MTYNFDKLVSRKGTDSVKHDLLMPTFGQEDLLPMWVADMDFETPDFIREAVLERARHPVYGYTFRGDDFYEAVAGWLHRRHGWDPGLSSLSFSPGVVPALNLSVMAFSNPGDRIIIQPPVYFPFFSAVKGHGREMVYNELVEERGRYSIDFDKLEEQFKAGAAMFILCNPHNPVGRAWTKDELTKIADLCLRYEVCLLSDEIHSDLLLFGHRHIPVASLDPEIAARTITCVAPSKTFNLAGMHSSALVIQNPEWKKRYETQLDLIHVGGGNLFGQIAMRAAYENGEEWLNQLLAYLEKNFVLLRDFLRTEIPDVACTPMEATYLAWLDFRKMGMSDAQLKEFVIEGARLGLNDGPMFGPGGSGFQRMNLACPAAVLNEALERLRKAVRETV